MNQYHNRAPVSNELNIRPQNFLQVNQFSNKIHPIDEVSMQSAVPLHGDQGVVYYSDLEEQTCASLRSFVKEPKRVHCWMMFWTLFLFMMFLIFIMLPQIIRIFALPMVFVSYLTYICFGICNNPISQFFSKMKNYSQMEGIIEDLRRRTGHIQLKAECYHFTTGKYRKRVVTHAAQFMIPVRECVDATENLALMKENNWFIFWKVNKYFYFADSNSHNTFLNTFNIFKNSNIQDTYQQYSHSLDITMPEFSEEIGLSIIDNWSCVRSMFLIFGLLGLGYPYVMAIEFMSQRYSVNLIKRLSL